MAKLFIRSFIILLLLCNIFPTHAQKGFSIEIIGQLQSVYVNGNVEIANPTSTGNPETSYSSLYRKSTYSMAEGLQADYGFNEKMAISVGILYSHQGQNFETWNYSSYANLTYSISLNYLKIPIEFHYKTTPGRKISFACYGGPYVALLLNYDIETVTNIPYTFYVNQNGNIVGAQDVTITYNTSGTTETAQSNGLNLAGPGAFNLNSKAINTVDMGATVGVGIEIKLSDKLLLPIMINCDVGLSDINNHSAEETIPFGNYPPLVAFYWGGNSNPNGNSILSNATLGFRVGLKMNL